MKQKIIMILFLLSLLFPITIIEAEDCGTKTALTVELGSDFGLCWDANEEADISKYKIFKNDVPFQEFEHSKCVDGLCYTERIPADSLGVFIFTVSAVSTSDKESEKSVSVELTVVSPTPKPPTGCSLRKF